MLYYNQAEVVVTEIPDELSLAISISGCPLACKGCHSAHTWSKTLGSPLTTKVLEDLINKYKHITCVLFYDGQHLEEELIVLLQAAKRYKLNTALYTGLESISENLNVNLDYLKVGPYVETLGGLSSKNTNQRLYHKGIDITHKLNCSINQRN